MCAQFLKYSNTKPILKSPSLIVSNYVTIANKLLFTNLIHTDIFKGNKHNFSFLLNSNPLPGKRNMVNSMSQYLTTTLNVFPPLESTL